MKILEAFPGKEIRCKNCNSRYLIYSTDILRGYYDHTMRDYCAHWDCPACGYSTGEWVINLPARWAQAIKNNIDSSPQGKQDDN